MVFEYICWARLMNGQRLESEMVGDQNDLRAIWICYSVELIFVQCLSFVSLFVTNVILGADYIKLFGAFVLSTFGINFQIIFLGQLNQTGV